MLAVAACGGDDDGSGTLDGTENCAGMEEVEGAVCIPNSGNNDGFFSDEDGDGFTPGNGLPADDPNCVGTTRAGENRPAVLQVVLDTSQSMSDGPGGGGGQSKWQITRDAFSDVVGSLSDSTSIGLMFYPYPPDYNGQTFAGQSCDGNPDAPVFVAENTVPVGALNAGQRQSIESALGDAGPSGSTPTHAAYLAAVNYVSSASGEGNKYIVLVTDGEPTYGLMESGGELVCTGTGLPGSPVDNDLFISDVQDAMASGVGTFVIGSPGSEPARSDLSRAARAGGTATSGCSDQGPNYCHLDMTEDPDFGQALRDGLGQVISSTEDPCRFDIPPAPDGQTLALDQVNIQFTDGSGGITDLFASETDCNDGDWQYNDSNTAILLCPNRCNEIESNPGLAVNVEVGCRTLRVGDEPRAR